MRALEQARWGGRVWRFRYSGTWRAPFLWRPLPDSSLAGQEHGPDHPNNRIRSRTSHFFLLGEASPFQRTGMIGEDDFGGARPEWCSMCECLASAVASTAASPDPRSRFLEADSGLRSLPDRSAHRVCSDDPSQGERTSRTHGTRRRQDTRLTTGYDADRRRQNLRTRTPAARSADTFQGRSLRHGRHLSSFRSPGT